MKDLKIGKFTVGAGHPVLIIAEAACEHRGSMDAAKRLIEVAKEAGADIVKFQLHVPKEEMIGGHPKMKFWAGSMEEVLKEVNFETKEQHTELKNYCEEVGIQYLCTPFCMGAGDILEEVGVVGYKTGSGELTNLPMLRHLAKKGKPMIVSTGMSSLEEIDDAVTVLKEEGVDFALTHCLSEYPASYENMNLGLIKKYMGLFDVPVGFSDHSTEYVAVVAAVACGARIIEKHLTIRDLHGPDDIVSLDPVQFGEMVRAIRNTEKALGSERNISAGEQKTRDWAEHSISVVKPIKKGEKITLDSLAPKRPGGGIPARYLDALYNAELIGKRAKYDMIVDTLVTWEMIE